MKLSNILIIDDDVRVSDFGVSKPIRQGEEGTRIIGTVSYMPPELLEKNDDDELEASTKHDIWSLGIIVYQIFNEAKHPFQKKNSNKISQNDILNNDYIKDYEKIPKNCPIDLLIKGFPLKSNQIIIFFNLF